MPSYEFECPKHGKFEIVVSISKHRDKWPCPKCKKSSEQITSAVAPAIFKRGVGGFHGQDYGSPTR